MMFQMSKMPTTLVSFGSTPFRTEECNVGFSRFLSSFPSHIPGFDFSIYSANVPVPTVLSTKYRIASHYAFQKDSHSYTNKEDLRNSASATSRALHVAKSS